MTTAKKKKEKRKRKLSSAKETARRGESFDRPYLKLPKGVNNYRPKKGKRTLDIIPYEVTEKGNPNADPGVLHYERTFYVHKGLGPNNETHLCPSKTKGKPCVVCKHIQKLKKADDDDNEDLIEKIKVKKRQLFNVMDKDGDDPDEIQVWDESYYLFGKFLGEEIDDTDNDSFHDPEEGQALAVRHKEKSGGGYTYVETNKVSFVDRDEQYDEDIVESATNLDEVLVETPAKKLLEVLLQEADEDAESDEDDDSDSAFAIGDKVVCDIKDEEVEGTVVKVDTKHDLIHVKIGGKTKPAVMDPEDVELVKKGKKKRKKEEDEDEEDEDEEEDTDDDDEDDEDEEEEKKPKKKGKKTAPPKKKKSKKDEDDEEDDDDDDDDGDEDDDEDDGDDEEEEDDEDEDEDEDEDDEDDEEEEKKPRKKKSKKPVKKPKKKSKKDDDDDEDEEEDEEEDEDDEDDDE